MPQKRKACEAIFERVVREEGQHLLGWRTVPIVRQRMRRHRAPGACRRFARSSSARGSAIADDERRSSASSTSFASASTNGALAMCLASGELFYVCSLSPRRSSTRASSSRTRFREFYPDLIDPGDDDRARDGASAVLDQHVPELGPRASVPLHRAQRRDQHAARQHQLDARAREAVRLADCSATTSRRSCRSSSPTAATRRCSTIASSCWCAPAARCRTR